ncbi:MAG: hypothetical protein AB7K09_03870 [Planctomycetota bacterium]
MASLRAQSDHGCITFMNPDVPQLEMFMIPFVYFPHGEDPTLPPPRDQRLTRWPQAIGVFAVCVLSGCALGALTSIAEGKDQLMVCFAVFGLAAGVNSSLLVLTADNRARRIAQIKEFREQQARQQREAERT